VKVAILSRSVGHNTASRIRLEALKFGFEALGFNCDLVDPSRVGLRLPQPGSTSVHASLRTAELTLVFNALSGTEEAHFHPYVRHYETAGVPVVNPLAGWLAAGQKDTTFQLLAQHGVPIPRTVIATQEEDLKAVVDSVGGFPVVVKKTNGLKGRGVFVAESLRNLRSVLQSLVLSSEPLVFQEFIKEAEGRDYKITSTRDYCLCAVQRVATSLGEFRANVALGGRATLIQPDKGMADLAAVALNAVGLLVGAVDIIKSSSGLLVIDVNDFPELNFSYGHLECFVERDYARTFVAHVVRVACPGMSIRDQDINSLCQSIPNPRTAADEYLRRLSLDQLIILDRRSHRDEAT